MTDWADITVKVLGLVGIGFGYWWGVRQWQEGQRWKRAERLDTLIREFETKPWLRLATKVVDWEAATVPFADGPPVVYGTKDVRAAMFVHWDAAPGASVEYPDPQNQIRDALDALLDFFVRLEHELSAHLIDERAAMQYFAYWIFRLETMEEHIADNEPANVVADKMRAYEAAYSDPDYMQRLYARLKKESWNSESEWTLDTAFDDPKPAPPSGFYQRMQARSRTRTLSQPRASGSS
ncbi:MAG TPA: hypothetical protein VH165_04185 [Kofleriaceae bacterium]|jgi:hypothetical protein|nr:hypothetical protein [Kofleriaceae bacterium]